MTLNINLIRDTKSEQEDDLISSSDASEILEISPINNQKFRKKSIFFRFVATKELDLVNEVVAINEEDTEKVKINNTTELTWDNIDFNVI